MEQTKKVEQKTWLEQFLDNYNGISPEAKSLEKELQKNYKGNAYIGWATMERLVYIQDPKADFEVYIAPTGTPLWTSVVNITTEQTKQGKDLIEAIKTDNARVVNFVRVSLKFLGKTFTEDYPVQDKSYQAPKFVDSNDVNKSVQRAKAKIASRATGLALKLYEGNDLQFDPPEKVGVANAKTSV
jgi:hypothetical protein